MPPPEPKPGLRIPKQARSLATLERFVEAALGLLETRAWDDIPVADIVRAAGASVGAFYARFTDKDALLDLLAERYTAEIATFAAQLKTLPGVPGGSAESRERALRSLLKSLVRAHRRRAPVLRALALRAVLHGKPMPQPPVQDFVRLAAGEDDVWLATRLSISLAVLRETFAFPELQATPPPESDEALIEDLVQLCLR
jgi:AcrR family transcriptional regulator